MASILDDVFGSPSSTTTTASPVATSSGSSSSDTTLGLTHMQIIGIAVGACGVAVIAIVLWCCCCGCCCCGERRRGRNSYSGHAGGAYTGPGRALSFRDKQKVGHGGHGYEMHSS